MPVSIAALRVVEKVCLRLATRAIDGTLSTDKLASMPEKALAAFPSEICLICNNPPNGRFRVTQLANRAPLWIGSGGDYRQ